MASNSSRTMARAAMRWPAASARCCKVSPERSSAALRVSDTVNSAMLTGRNGRSWLSGIGGSSSGLVQPRLEREQVAPGLALALGRAQQEGGMEHRQGRHRPLQAGHGELEPAPADAGDAVADRQ